MKRFDTLRDAVLAIAHGCGELHFRYDREEAIALVPLLRKCGPTLAEPVAATPDQEELRRLIQRLCHDLEGAVRRAIAAPAASGHQEAMVKRVGDLLPLLHRAHDLLV